MKIFLIVISLILYVLAGTGVAAATVRYDPGSWTNENGKLKDGGFLMLIIALWPVGAVALLWLPVSVAFKLGTAKSLNPRRAKN